MYLAWDLQTQWPNSNSVLNSVMISHESAQAWLQTLEPIQLGYGAVIISFLGAVHWVSTATITTATVALCT